MTAEPRPDGICAEFWALDARGVAARLDCSASGLGSDEAAKRLMVFGPNRAIEDAPPSPFRLLVRQFESPLVLILIFGAIISLTLREWLDASVIIAIVACSGLLGFLYEFRASSSIAKLRARLALRATVWREGNQEAVLAERLVPGDVVLLNAGDLIPADCLVLEATDFLVTEASLTGESFPVEKRPGITPAAAPLAARTNAVFAGSSVRSGTARALVVETGPRTAFAAIAADLAGREPETDFARGIRQFGTMLVRVMIAIVLSVLTVNQLLGRPIDQSLLYAVALAVGLTPELLPAIISVMLASGARRLADGGVIVRRLEAIENLGSMEVLCTDKTGTLTEGTVAVLDAVDAAGRSAPAVRRLAFLNAAFETGIDNPLDAAILADGERAGLATAGLRKIDEIPYDFTRRRLTIVFEEPGGERRIVTKGAFASVTAICTAITDENGSRPLDAPARERLEEFVRIQGEAGVRVLAVAARTAAPKDDYTVEDEAEMAFRGFLLLRDPPRFDAAETLAALAALGVKVKIVTGDNFHVAAAVARAVGLEADATLTGAELAQMKDEALWYRAPRTDVFAEIDPQQKERIVRALQRTGLSVGYLGDGINDAPALKAADVGISAEQAVDVARESADIILLRPDLGVLSLGIAEGRRTFANTLKYIHITTSANFGNMISMAAATPFLPYLPLLPKQILLNNFISDLPAFAIATDNVDAERVARPQEWDVPGLRRFMLTFGLVSSAFDLVTFVVLLWVLQADERLFQTGWFVVSLMTELVVVLILRTHRPVLRSRPGSVLLLGTLAVGVAAMAIPYIGDADRVFGFVPPSFLQTAVLLTIVAGYAVATEGVKLWYLGSKRGPALSA